MTTDVYRLKTARTWPGLPDYYCEHEGDSYHTLLRAIHRGCPFTLNYLIYESSPPIYEWRWQSGQRLTLLAFFQTQALHHAAAGLSHDIIQRRDSEARAKLQALASRSSSPTKDEREVELMHRLVSHCPRPDSNLALFPFLWGVELELHAGLSQHGSIDLLFCNADATIFCVVEVKHLDLDGTGHTARVRRTKKRSKVQQQALDYRDKLVGKWTMAWPTECHGVTEQRPPFHYILAATYINERDQSRDDLAFPNPLEQHMANTLRQLIETRRRRPVGSSANVERELGSVAQTLAPGPRSPHLPAYRDELAAEVAMGCVVAGGIYLASRAYRWLTIPEPPPRRSCQDWLLLALTALVCLLLFGGIAYFTGLY